MPSDLNRFDLAGMLHCSLGLRKAAAGATSMEEAATRVCRFLYDEFRAPVAEGASEGERQCALVRLYKTNAYSALDAPLRAFADALLGTSAPEGLRCLCLLATQGSEPAWNDRRASRGHQAIPLPSPEMVEQAPMVAQLVRQFGLDLADVVTPSPALMAKLEGRTYGVFHVERALASPYIPAQRDFVIPHGIRSVVGFGGALRSGDIFAVILFSRATVSREAADRFRTLALDVKSILFGFDDGRVFATA